VQQQFCIVITMPSNALAERLLAEDEIDVAPDIDRIERTIQQGGSGPGNELMMAYGYTLVRSQSFHMQTKGIAILKSTNHKHHQQRYHQHATIQSRWPLLLLYH
jgi:hypothetical protein